MQTREPLCRSISRMARRRFLPLLVSLVLASASAVAGEGVLVMGYPEREKMPLIEAAPSNAGVFEDLYQEVARRLGVQLQIRRAPKKRLYAEMDKGAVDFYPSAGFAEDRAAVIHWISNGLKSRDVCLTRNAVPEITDLAAAPKMRLIAELGGVKINRSKHPNITVLEVPSYLDIELAVRLLARQRGDLYIADAEVFDYYLKSHRLTNLGEVGLKLHPDCLEKLGPTYLGFARKSQHFAEVPNPAYRPDQPLSGKNQPTLVHRDSLAGKMAEVLQQMEMRGETQKIYARHVH